jgi:hypothetical protein
VTDHLGLPIKRHAAREYARTKNEAQDKGYHPGADRPRLWFTAIHDLKCSRVVAAYSLERGPHHASLGAEGGAVDDGALVAGDESYDGGDFFGLLEAFQERTGANLLKQFLANRGRAKYINTRIRGFRIVLIFQVYLQIKPFLHLL